VRRRLPTAFVVTVSAVAGAGTGGCHTEEPIHANPPPQEPQWNPPPPTAAVTEPGDAGPVEGEPSDASLTAPLYWNPPRQMVETLNATDRKTAQPILKTETGCEVDPGLDFHRGAGRRPRSHAVKCPAAMNDPAWRACLHGTLDTTITTDADGGALCSCNNHGNPPRVTSVPCPTLR
jgi:hypothetical protein